jgi:hypothetical protein
LTGLVGQSWAAAGSAAINSASTATTIFMLFLI